MASVEYLGHIFEEKGIMMISTLFAGFHCGSIDLYHASNHVDKENMYFRDLTEAARNAFCLLKDLLANSVKQANMNPDDPLLLYMDESMNAIGDVLMQVQCVFVSHTLSEQTSRWGIMELELCVFVYCPK